MYKNIGFTLPNGSLAFIVPGRECIVTGIRVEKVHKTILFTSQEIEASNDLPDFVDVSRRNFTLRAVRKMAFAMNITFSDDMVVLEPEDSYLDRVEAKELPADAINVFRIERENVIQDRVFRDEWENLEGESVTVNMPKARDKHMLRIRGIRNNKLNELDKDWMKFKGQNDETNADSIEQTRQVLRDIPDTFDLSAHDTPEALKAAWPTELERREHILKGLIMFKRIRAMRRQ